MNDTECNRATAIFKKYSKQPRMQNLIEGENIILYLPLIL